MLKLPHRIRHGSACVSSCGCTSRRLRVLQVVCLIICHTVMVSSFIIPSGPASTLQASKLVSETCRSHAPPNRNGDFLHISFSPSLARKSALNPKTCLCAKEDDKADEKKKNIFNRVGKLGSRVISSVKGDRDKIKEGGDQGESSGKRRKLASVITGKSPSNVSEKQKEIDEQTKSQDDREEARTQSSFIALNTVDPFQSEIALANELKKQQALYTYMSGDEKVIPEEFLPKNAKNDVLGVDQTLSIIDDSLSFIRGKLGTVRLNEDDETNPFFLTPNQEEKRLNQIRRDLERRRKDVLLKQEKEKKEKDARDRARAAKVRAAAASAKMAKEQKLENERKKKAREMKQKNISKAAKGIDVKPLENENADDVDEEKDDNVDDSKRKGIGNFVDGVVSGAQSTIGSAWQTIKATTKKSHEDDWITVCPKTRISPGEVYPVVAGGLDLLIIGSKDGTKVHCISNTCPHLGTPLETGMIERRPCPKQSGPSSQAFGLNTNDNTKRPLVDGLEECIVCPLHNTAFALDTGEVRGPWCPHPPILGKVMGQVKARNNLTTFQMRSRGKMLQIKISSRLD